MSRKEKSFNMNSPTENLFGSPHLAGRQMSSSLKEKLKRMGRSRSSPMASPSVLRSSTKETVVRYSLISGNRKTTSGSSSVPLRDQKKQEVQANIADFETSDDQEVLKVLATSIGIRIAEKRELLKKLEISKLYRTKNNLEDLEKLIQKWREVSQTVIQELYDQMPQPKSSLTQMIDYLQIDHKLIRYVAEDENFI